MGSASGAEKTAARRVGVTVEEWRARRAAGQKWCTTCSAWLPIENFAADRSRGDGRKANCRACASRLGRESLPPRQHKIVYVGTRRVDPRDGDQAQARGRVNYLVRAGVLPAPNDLPCVDCGHIWTPGNRRHEYDHHRGYDAAHHEDVEAVCTTCHHLREAKRRG